MKFKNLFKTQKKEKIFNRIEKEDLNYIIDFLKEKNFFLIYYCFCKKF